MISRDAAFRAVLGISTGTMMAISWPLWVSTGSFPRVPFVRGIVLLPLAASWFRFGSTLGLIGASAAGFRPRITLTMALLLCGWMVLEDQFRLQPWMYQFLLMGIAIVCCPPAESLGLCRLLVIAVYLHSGLSKLDVGFVEGLGTAFLRAVGIEPGRRRYPLTLAMPAFEILVAIGLIFPRTRKAALGGAILIHVALIVILGPWGLNHSANVILWNASLIVEVSLLFAGSTAGQESGAPNDETRYPMAPFARMIFVLAALLPLGERWGLWDSWPSFALYSGHDEQVECFVDPEDADLWPEVVRRHLKDDQPRMGRRIDLSGWSLQERRTPIYPSARALNGVAEAIQARYGGPRLLRVVVKGRADRAGSRSATQATGLREIRRLGERYFINSRPAP